MATIKKSKPKGKPRGRPFTKGYDERRNLEGAPPRGASLVEIFDFYDQKTADEIAEFLPPGDLQRMYRQMPKGVSLKHLKALRINAAIMFDPTPGLIKEWNDRTDGKVAEKLRLDGVLEVENLKAVLNKVYSGNSNDNSG